MELLAVIKGLETLKRPCAVSLYTDSKYIADAVNNVDEGYEKTMGTARTSSKPRRVAASSRKAYRGGGRRR